MLPSRKLLAAAALALVATPSFRSTPAAPSASDDYDRRQATWEVSVTNLTRGQIFSPPVIAVHSRKMKPLWELGEPASMELAGVAEDAANQPLIDAIVASGEARDVKVITGMAGPIMPGETASTRIRGDARRFDRISMAGMLVITNDAFFGLNGVQLPDRGERKSRMSPAYDAGSEANNELCGFIPGPPCNNPGMRAPEGAEGFVHIHAGIHGIGDLAPEAYDWRDRVALIRIRRIR